MRLNLNTPLRRLVVAAGFLSLAASAAADITGHWTNFQDWEYRATEMPDLDQGRGAGGGAFALPNNGFMYCAPTATMNVLLYAAHHGSPALLNGWSAPGGYAPADANWFDWRAGAAGNNAFYNHGGMNASGMGGLMGTHGTNGTGFAGIYWGARRAFGNKFDVHAYFMSPWYTPTLTRVGQAGMERGAVVVVVGYYQVVGISPLGIPVVVRNGGHVMTLSRARRLGMNCWAWCRDPADDLVPPFPPPAAVLTAQDNFKDRAYTVLDGWVLYAQPGFPLHYRYMSAFVSPGPQQPGQLVMLDGFMTIRPRSALVRKAFQGAAGPVPAIERVEPATWSGASTGDEWILSPSGTEILDYAQFGAGSSVAVLTAPATKGNPAQLWVVNQYTGESELAGEIQDATALISGHPPELWVLAGDTAHLVWLDPTESEYPDGSPPGALLGSITLPAEPELLRFDDANRRLIAVDMDARMLHVVAVADPPVIASRSLPAGVPDGAALTGDVEVLLDDPAGSLLINVAGSDRVIELDLEDPLVIDREFTIDAPAEDLSLSDGRLFAIVNDEIQEYVKDAMGDWVLVPGSEFSETEVEGSIRVVRSQSNFDSMIHEGDDFNNIDPPDIVPGFEVSPCLGDLDLDGIVGLSDLLILLGKWGVVSGEFVYEPADLEPDFKIDFDDLLWLLSLWGPCPES